MLTCQNLRRLIQTGLIHNAPSISTVSTQRWVFGTFSAFATNLPVQAGLGLEQLSQSSTCLTIAGLADVIQSQCHLLCAIRLKGRKLDQSLDPVHQSSGVF